MATSSPATMGAASLDASPTSKQPQSHIVLEMSNLDVSTGVGAGSHNQNNLSHDVVIPSQTPISSTIIPTPSKMASTGDEKTSAEQSSNPTISADPTLSADSEPVASSSTSGPSSLNPPAIARLDSVAIGPAVESVAPPVISEAGPVLVITLLLTSGARHPYKIDEKYLTKRNVTIPDVTESGRKDPLSISVYTLKELILREWREEWETQPSSPSSIRLIFFGRLLDDKTPLKECRFNGESPNVVHMTVRPQDIVDEEDASKSKALARERDGGESNAGCRCIIL